MALGVLNSYENSASISTTEYSLPGNTTTAVPLSKTDHGVVQLWLNLAAMIAGDQYELKLYEMVVAAGTQRLVETWIFDGAQGTPHQIIDIGILLNAWDITMKRLAGADRTIGWSIRAAS